MYTKTDRCEQLASKIELEGRNCTDNGNWITYFDEFEGDELNFLIENKEEITTILNNREAVAVALLICDDPNSISPYLDVIYYLNYCPNVDEEEYLEMED